MYSNKKTRKLSIERLNQRNLLAGDCAVALEDGELTIECDDQDNEIFVGDFLFEDVVIGFGTTINGSTAPFSFAGEELEEVNIDMGEGDDNLGFVFLTAERVSIETGGGNDQIGMLGVMIDKAFVDLGEGDDTLVANGTFKKLKADGGSGMDLLGDNTSEDSKVKAQRFEGDF